MVTHWQPKRVVPLRSARYGRPCYWCGLLIAPGASAVWYPDEGLVAHAQCDTDGREAGRP